MTTIRDLIDELEALASEHGDECEVRLAHQPQWPFEHAIGQVIATDTSEGAEERDAIEAEMRDPRHLTADDRLALEERLEELDEAASSVVVYIAEAGQLGYLPGAVARELGWGR